MIAIVKPFGENAIQQQSGPALIKFGIIGYGYWGPNVVRNLDRLDETKAGIRQRAI